MTESDIGSIRADLHDLETLMARELAEIKTLLNTEAQRCPYRETIAMAANTALLVKTLTETVQQGRVDAAKAAVAGGATTGGIITAGGIVFAGIGKLVGWW